MAIEFRCSQCNQLLRVPDNSAGKNARCPKCQALMHVPAASPLANPAGTPVPPPPVPGSAFAEGTSQQPAAPFSFAPAPPAAKSDDPFSFLAPPSSSSTSPAPPAFNPPAKPANPFGEGGSSTSSGGNPFASASPFGGASSSSSTGTAPNPYATPAPIYSPYNTVVAQSGLPWEVKRQTFGCWFETAGIILGSPSRAFTIMRKRGGMGAPIKYNIFGLGMPMAAAMMLFVPLMLLIGFAGGGNDPAMALGGMAIGIVVVLLIAVVAVVGAATIGNMIGAGIWHLFLMMVGGGKHGYETTFQVTSYVSGSLAWLGFIPYIGGFIQMIWMIVLLIIGFSKAHEISGGKAALAVLLPFGLCMAAYIGLIVLLVSGAVLSGQ